MNKKIKEIILIMENCEHFTIPYKNIISISIEKITEDYFSIANAIVHQRKCKSLYLILDSSAALLFGKLQKNIQLYNRIKSNDITNIELIFDDESKDYITVRWSDEKQYINMFQTSRIDSNGTIEIFIKKISKKS